MKIDIYIALCKFSRVWLRFSSFWGNFFKDLLIWLIIGWQVCIPGGVSDKYSIYCNLVVIIFSKFQQPIDIFKKSLPLLWKPQGKIKFLFIQEPWIYFPVKSRNSQIFYITNIITFSKFAQEMYFYLLVASLHVIQIKSKILIHSSISCRLACPNEWFQVELFWRKYNEKLHFRI